MKQPVQTLYELLLEIEADNDDGDDDDNGISEEKISQKYLEFIRNVVLVFVESKNETISEEDLAKDTEDLLDFTKNLRQVKFTNNL